MPSINTAYQWLVNACNAPNIGYSQTYRRGQTVGGVTYYDCSSIISKALTVGGFFSENPWFTTRSMRQYLINAGFTAMSTDVAWIPGDILVTVSGGHTEMCYSGGDPGQGGITMGAHTDGVPLADQVSISSSPTRPSYYETLYRYQDATPLTWIKGNRYLTDIEMQNNSYVFYSSMASKGFTLNAIAGMLGNMESESNINPAIWQNLDFGNYDGGYGLVQWTPATNYTTWAGQNGYEIEDGEPQCIWLDTETEATGQWIPTDIYNMTWQEFKNSTQTPDYLASAFLKNFERAGVEVENERRQQALKWYQYLMYMTPYPPPNAVKRKHMPLYYYLFPF